MSNQTLCFVASRRLFVCSLLVAIFGLPASIAKSQQAEATKAETNTLVIELFARPDSQQCQRAEEFLAKLKSERTGVEVRVYDVTKNRDALVRLNDLTKRYGYEKPGVPSIFVSNSFFVGYRDERTTGHDIEKRLKIRAYVRTGCKHCQAARKFMDGLQERWPALTIEYFDVVSDVNARNEAAELARLYRVRLVSFPCIEVAGRLVVGYQDDESSGKEIEGYFLNPGALNPEAEEHKNKEEATQKAKNSESPEKPAETKQHGMRILPRNLPIAWVITYVSVPQQGSPAEPVKGAAASEDATSTSEEEISDDLFPEEVILPEEVTLPEESPGSSIRDGPSVRDSPVIHDDQQKESMDVPVFGRLRVKELGMVTFTFLIGLVDGFNPCAMWVLVFLLSVLVNIKERKKIIVIAGTFVVVSGLAYFAFMAAWFSVFQLIGLIRPVQIGLGLVAIVVGAVNVKDFFAFHKGISFSIPESAKPGIYRRVRKIVSAKNMTVALSGAIVLAVVVNIVELLCTAGLPARYTEILTMQNLPTWAEYSYLGLYIAAYMLDDAILVTIVVCTLSHRKMQETEGRWLKLLSGCVILLLGALMILKPEWLV